MSTDQTPALARATEALNSYWGARYPSGSQADNMAKDAVSAALHDPDLVRTLARHQEEANDAGLIQCQCADTAWFDTPGEFAAHQADAVRAAILGSDQ